MISSYGEAELRKPDYWLWKMPIDVPSVARKLLSISIVLIPMNWIVACGSINAPMDGCEWVRPIIVDEGDSLTTATKRALLAHNESWSEFCK